MTNTQAFGLTTPRTDTHIAQTGQPEAPVVITARSTAMPAPDGNTSYVSTQEVDTVRAFVRYTGTVTSGTLVLWVLQDGAWYRATEDALDSANGNEVFDGMLLGRHTQFAYQIADVAGGGTVEVRVNGVY